MPVSFVRQGRGHGLRGTLRRGRERRARENDGNRATPINAVHRSAIQYDAVVSSEVWRPVPGWEEYEVSSLGRVWSKPGFKRHWRGGLQQKRGQMLKPARGANGRLQVTLAANGRRENRAIHSLVAEAFLGPRPEGLDCCHGDGDVDNNAASNLRWDTPGSNILDEVRHGTHRNSRKTHCRLRHPLCSPNLIEGKNNKGTRTYRCKSCFNARMTIAERTGSGKGAHLRPEFKAMADERCDRLMPGWRDWIPPEGFSRTLAVGGSSGGR
jgi:hypothetical protein